MKGDRSKRASSRLGDPSTFVVTDFQLTPFDILIGGVVRPDGHADVQWGHNQSAMMISGDLVDVKRALKEMLDFVEVCEKNPIAA